VEGPDLLVLVRNRHVVHIVVVTQSLIN
jgi:hypothetical protein